MEKYYSIHRPKQGEDFGDCVCEAETIEQAIECARLHLESVYSDNGDYVRTEVDMVLCTNYDNGNYTFEDVNITIDARKENDTRKSDYLASVM